MVVGQNHVGIQGGALNNGRKELNILAQIDAHPFYHFAAAVVVGNAAIDRVIGFFAATKTNHIFVASFDGRHPFDVGGQHFIFVYGREGEVFFQGRQFKHFDGFHRTTASHQQRIFVFLSGNGLQGQHTRHTVHQFFYHLALFIHQIELQFFAIATNLVTAHGIENFKLIVVVEQLAADHIFSEVAQGTKT